MHVQHVGKVEKMKRTILSLAAAWGLGGGVVVIDANNHTCGKITLLEKYQGNIMSRREIIECRKGWKCERMVLVTLKKHYWHMIPLLNVLPSKQI